MVAQLCAHADTSMGNTLPGAALQGARMGLDTRTKLLFWPKLTATPFLFLTSYMNKRVFLEMSKSPEGEKWRVHEAQPIKST